MELIEKNVKSELIYDGVIVHLYRDTVLLPNGGEALREIVKHVGAVCIVPVTDEGDVILERQYRYAVGEILTEIPAGKLNSADEDPAGSQIDASWHSALYRNRGLFAGRTVCHICGIQERAVCAGCFGFGLHVVRWLDGVCAEPAVRFAHGARIFLRRREGEKDEKYPHAAGRGEYTGDVQPV